MLFTKLQNFELGILQPEKGLSTKLSRYSEINLVRKLFPEIVNFPAGTSVCGVE